MSSTLHWRPTNYKGEHLGDTLKFPLRSWLDGNHGGIISDWTEIGRSAIPWLEGLIAGAGSKSQTGLEAQELIDLLHKHGAVEIREVY